MAAASAAQTSTNATATIPSTAALPRETKGKVGFLAGAGLLIISVLALATALALVRSFRR
jgi:hypothetical protein